MWGCTARPSGSVVQSFRIPPKRSKAIHLRGCAGALSTDSTKLNSRHMNVAHDSKSIVSRVEGQVCSIVSSEDPKCRPLWQKHTLVDGLPLQVLDWPPRPLNDYGFRIVGPGNTGLRSKPSGNMVPHISWTTSCNIFGMQQGLSGAVGCRSLVQDWRLHGKTPMHIEADRLSCSVSARESTCSLRCSSFFWFNQFYLKDPKR